MFHYATLSIVSGPAVTVWWTPGNENVFKGSGLIFKGCIMYIHVEHVYCFGLPPSTVEYKYHYHFLCICGEISKNARQEAILHARL